MVSHRFHEKPPSRFAAHYCGCFRVALLILVSLHPAVMQGQTFEHYLGMVPVPYDPSGSCADIPQECGSGVHASTGGLGLRVIQLYWRGTNTEGARFALFFPADWSIHEVEFCEGIIPVAVGTEPGELFELDFGECRETEPVRLGRVVFNVRSRGNLYADEEAVRPCAWPGFEETIGHGRIELGLACEIEAPAECGFCGHDRFQMNPDRFERVLMAGSSHSDTLVAGLEAVCYTGTCTDGVTPCHSFPESQVSWATLNDLGGNEVRPFRVDYGVETFPPGRYQGGIRIDDCCCCAGDCLALDIQVIEEEGGNRQPVARIRPFGAEVSPVQFDGTGSFDLDGSPLTYHWDFGDGVTASDPMPIHGFALGPATVTLVVSDGILESTPDSLRFDVVPPGTTTSVGDPSPVTEPAALEITLEAPNPLLPGAGGLRFTLSSAARVRVELFDVSGRSMGILAEGDFAAGAHAVVWEAGPGPERKIRAGIYFVRLTDNHRNVAVKKLVLLN